MDVNVTEIHDLHMYHFSWYLNLKGGIAIFEPFPIREWLPLLWEMDSISIGTIPYPTRKENRPCNPTPKLYKACRVPRLGQSQ